MRRRRDTVAAVLLGLAAACAGGQRAPPTPALCELDRGAAASTPPDAATWVALLLRGYDATTGRVTVPALDCTGTQVRWTGPALGCDDGALARTALPERPLATDDVVTSPAPDGSTLVWITTEHYASGDALGPVARVDAMGSKLRATAVGVLRAYPRDARLRLESFGGRLVLVAEGEACRSTDAATCPRSARVVPLRGDRYVPEPVAGEDGRCLSPAWFDLRRVEERRAGSRAERVELVATLVFEPLALTVDEQVLVQEAGARAGGPPARVLHRAQSRRTVRWKDDRLVGSGDPLWPRMAPSRAGPVR